MNDSAEALNGRCLCGAVRFRVTAPVITMGHCHCSMCRHAHGTAFSTYCQVDAAAVEVSAGRDAITRYDSSPGAAREFCRHCGSKLFYRAREMPEFLWVAAGALDDDPGVRPDFHIFVASKAPWHEITDALPRYDEFPPGDGH